MSRCPFARWRPLPENATEPSITPTQFIVHSAVDHPGRTDLRNYFDNAGVYVESHFWVYLDGTLDQYVDTSRSADANYRANRRSDGTGAISVETEDEGNPDVREWTDAQVATLVRLGRWLVATHDRIPPRECRNPNDPGVGYHSMFGAPSDWTTQAGKTCPGRARIRQFPMVLDGIRGHVVSAGEVRGLEEEMRQGDRGADVRAWQFRLREWAGINVTVDGNFGPQTAKATKEWQKRVGLDQTGVVNLMTLGLLVYTRNSNELSEHRDDDPHGGGGGGDHTHKATVVLS